MLLHFILQILMFQNKNENTIQEQCVKSWQQYVKAQRKRDGLLFLLYIAEAPNLIVTFRAAIIT